ncbi:hypothetical protein [Paenibacillus popilliae]|uniref:Uncharacterized protein n=1 Tax=Paenibacillus popilliae TaxID=78057 RepID=A0ABY3AI46_PAEPP|nr:hypothetical protein [Paenibacillus sp. SDF0028]TQR41688.1 hypothetical protein C7Y44_24465 [Paenibacillus sp. SDF0028]
MNIERVFTGTTDFKTLIISQLEKEIENIVSAAYNDKQVDIVATRSATLSWTEKLRASRINTS